MKERKTIRTIQAALSLLGLAIAIYLTLYHYLGIPLACSDTGIINCESVLNSTYAYVFGLPLAVYGIIFFAVELLVLYTKNLDAITIWNMVGIAAVAYFISIEWVIGHICLWCTSVHVIVLLLLILSVYAQTRKK